MITIKTTDDLLALLDKNGRREITDDCRIECDVPMLYCGDRIRSITVRGNLSVRGPVYVRSSINVHGSLSGGSYIEVGGSLSVGSYISVRGLINVGGALSVGGDLDVRGNLYVGGEKCTVEGFLYWSHSAMPTIPEDFSCLAVVPPSWQRNHWARRLGVPLYGCYSTILNSLNIASLRQREGWSETELWMLDWAEKYQNKTLNNEKGE